VWGVAGGLFLSVIPSYAFDVFATTNLACWLLTALMLGTSCVVQVLIRRGAPPRRPVDRRCWRSACSGWCWRRGWRRCC
jgi:hypothetical protein